MYPGTGGLNNVRFADEEITFGDLKSLCAVRQSPFARVQVGRLGKINICCSCVWRCNVAVTGGWTDSLASPLRAGAYALTLSRTPDDDHTGSSYG